jgi:hypothetical protein
VRRERKQEMGERNKGGKEKGSKRRSEREVTGSDAARG